MLGTAAEVEADDEGALDVDAESMQHEQLNSPFYDEDYAAKKNLGRSVLATESDLPKLINPVSARISNAGKPDFAKE